MPPPADAGVCDCCWCGLRMEEGGDRLNLAMLIDLSCSCCDCCCRWSVCSLFLFILGDVDL